VFGRLGSRPFLRGEMERFFMNRRGVPYRVIDSTDLNDWVPARTAKTSAASSGRASRR
jgi:hypothetical protein